MPPLLRRLRTGARAGRTMTAVHLSCAFLGFASVTDEATGDGVLRVARPATAADAILPGR